MQKAAGLIALGVTAGTMQFVLPNVILGDQGQNMSFMRLQAVRFQLNISVFIIACR